MLAQLEHRDDVESAEVDRRGELLRIRLRPEAVTSAIRDELERIGFAADEASDPPTADTRWYGVSDVGELSRDEGRVIAARVVPPFGASNGLAPEQIAALSEVVAAALYACFVAHRDTALAPGGVAASCGRAVEAAAGSILGGDRSAALASAVEADLTGADRR